MPIHHDAIIIISIQMLSSHSFTKSKSKNAYFSSICNAHWNFFSLVSNLPLYSYLLLCSMIGVIKPWPWAKAMLLQVFIKFYWNIATFIFSHIVYGWFCKSYSRGVIAKDTVWAAEPKIFFSYLSMEKTFFCWSLFLKTLILNHIICSHHFFCLPDFVNGACICLSLCLGGHSPLPA